MNGTGIVERFDKEAGGWDERPDRIALAAAITKALDNEIKGVIKPRLLDYGAGTGLCSLPLAARCSSVLAVDVSSGMLGRLKEKSQASGFSHVSILQQDFCIEPLAGYEFDVILCAMTMHHVRNIALLLHRFRDLLADGGILALADLDHEDGTFHRDNTGVEHFGFRRDWLLDRLFDAGFPLVDVQTVHRIEKPASTGLREYPVFFAAARLQPPPVA